MHFFLTEILARIVAGYLFCDSARKVWFGLRERKIMSFNPDLLDWWSRGIVERDAAPMRFWIEIAFQMFAIAACFVVAIFGWQQPQG